MITENLKTYEKAGLTIQLDAVDFCEGCSWLNDLYTSSEHIAGTTVTSPSANGHYIGQTTPSELTKSYAKQGKENPSKEAYASLSEELEHYIWASDCAIKATVSKNGIELASNYSYGFEYSHIYGDTLESKSAKMLEELDDDFINEAINEAVETLKGLAA